MVGMCSFLVGIKICHKATMITYKDVENSLLYKLFIDSKKGKKKDDESDDNTDDDDNDDDVEEEKDSDTEVDEAIKDIITKVEMT